VSQYPHRFKMRTSSSGLDTSTGTTTYNNHTTQHNTTQHNTTQHNTTQHNTTQHNTTQHNTTTHSTPIHNTDYAQLRWVDGEAFVSGLNEPSGQFHRHGMTLQIAPFLVGILSVSHAKKYLTSLVQQQQQLKQQWKKNHHNYHNYHNNPPQKQQRNRNRPPRRNGHNNTPHPQQGSPSVTPPSHPQLPIPAIPTTTTTTSPTTSTPSINGWPSLRRSSESLIPQDTSDHPPTQKRHFRPFLPRASHPPPTLPQQRL